ncbi:pyrroline-5-carboxylate reductase [Kordia periserrulae]|uniref:Pyrroline-5-carboxylate reductase n=1 Tax=Kordia periserrulae TaxID=701523 RepID=A0A2T6BXV9_9FLAO|nr:pyrroline-5-carboxylate reductase [Kordia periserrulae]PTX60911.1 pyrroline-5-carboxylate reductase [Kordia periserrulae]
MNHDTIAIIGGGNLGKSIAQGLLKQHNPSQMYVTRTKVALLDDLKAIGVHTTSDNILAVQQSKILIFALKPYRIESVLKELAPYITENHLVISVISDFSIEQLKSCVSDTVQIVRAMPNTAAAIGESLTCLATKNASAANMSKAKLIFDSLGETIEIDESLMDAATVLGACGIAYVLRFIRAMIQGGIEIGFDAKTATKIASQTVKGASELLLQNGNHPEEEIDKVTTPKGCTIAGLNEMEHQGFSSSLIKGIKTSIETIQKD